MQELVPESNLLRFMRTPDGDYNRCHFWSNFEIVDLGFFRSEAYTRYFNYLDRTGGFFLERWGDAPVHSLGAAILLNSSQVGTGFGAAALEVLLLQRCACVASIML